MSETSETIAIKFDKVTASISHENASHINVFLHLDLWSHDHVRPARHWSVHAFRERFRCRGRVNDTRHSKMTSNNMFPFHSVLALPTSDVGETTRIHFYNLKCVVFFLNLKKKLLLNLPPALTGKK